MIGTSKSLKQMVQTFKQEKLKALSLRRQAQDEPAERLFFNLLDGLACDLEPMAPRAGQSSKGLRMQTLYVKRESYSDDRANILNTKLVFTKNDPQKEV